MTTNLTAILNNTAFINSSGSTGAIFSGLVENVAGSVTGAIMLLILIIMVLTLVFRLPLEFSALFVFPLLMVCFAFNVGNLGVLIVTMVLYLGVLIAKNFLTR